MLERIKTAKLVVLARANSDAGSGSSSHEVEVSYYLCTGSVSIPYSHGYIVDASYRRAS
jgi:hypothetical protein